MSIEQKGPGGVGNSYGQRSTVTPSQISSAGVVKPYYDEFSISPVSGDGSVTVNNRDGQGRVTSYTQAGVTYTVTYGTYGVATESGGGYIWTYNYDAAGNLTSVTKA